MTITTHPLSAKDKDITAAMRAATAPNKGRLRGIGARAPFDAIIGAASPADGVTYLPDTVGGISGWWCLPPGAQVGRAVLHVHGGWFHWGSAQAYRHLVGQIAARARADTFIPDYRLAPEHVFPAGLTDVEACFLGLGAKGYGRIAVTGDSAGGNLALVLASRSMEGSSPVAIAVLSPVTDLSMSSASWDSRADADFFFTRSQAEELAGSYLAGADPCDPLASPVFARLDRLPPIRAHVGDQEALLDDSRRFVERAVAAGVDARLDIWSGMPHGFAGGVGKLSAADQALDSIGEFLAGHLAA